MRRQKTLMNTEKRQKLLPDYGRSRLLTYADSFRELAETFEDMPEKEDDVNLDRQEMLWKRKLKDTLSVFIILSENIIKIQTSLTSFRQV